MALRTFFRNHVVKIFLVLCLICFYLNAIKQFYHTKSNIIVFSKTSKIKKELISCPVIRNNQFVLFLDSLNSDWFVAYARNYSQHTNDGSYDITLGSITLHPENIKGLLKNHRSLYRKLAFWYCNHTNQFYNILNGSIFGPKHHMKRYATFNNVAVTTDGHIISKETCKIAKNGGCLSPKIFNSYIEELPRYDSVLSISAFWSYGIWHFPMEALVGLQAMDTWIDKNTIIHISAKTNFTLSWLKLIGKDLRFIITGNVFAKQLIVPEIGQCGSPSFQQVKWLRDSIHITSSSKQNKVVLIKRTKKRKMIKFDDILHLTSDIAKQNGLQIVIHDDSKLPALNIQLKLFREAKIVIGPHGAGLINLISSEPGTCVIEFLSTDPNICYMRLSYILGLKYISIPLYMNRHIVLDNLKDAINMCFSS